MAAVCFTLVTLPMAGAAEKSAVQTKRHKVTVKKSPQRVAKAAKFKKTAIHPRKTATKTGPQKKSASKSPSNSLKLSRNIELSKQEPPQTVQPKPKQFNQISPKLPQDSSEPPLQIGKTLYQRNGEIRQLESQ
jgi:hypothetical protein